MHFKKSRVNLYREIVKVLPTDLRALVVAKKKQIDQAKKDINTPIGKWDFMVAGVRYEGRPNIIYRHAKEGDPVFLLRDRENVHSGTAVAVLLKNGMQIGFVPAEWSVEIAPLLDAGNPHTGVMETDLTGGKSPIPVVVAKIFAAHAEVPELVFERDVPRKVVLESAPKEEVFWCTECGAKLYGARSFCSKCGAQNGSTEKGQGIPVASVQLRPVAAPTVNLALPKKVARDNPPWRLIGLLSFLGLLVVLSLVRC